MTESAPAKTDHLSQVRDSVESVYVAIVLAFVLRAFMIEAFVIPTGSMANALYGEHFQLTCPSCGWSYAIGRDQKTSPYMGKCPNCFAQYRNVRSNRPDLHRGGDRVLVMKYLYDFFPPQPWDVVVFKNPQNNRENYIKRLIGLPGEGIQIVHGDIFVSPDEGKTWRVRRKTPQAQEAMWQVVHNSDYPASPNMVVQVDTPRWIAPQAQATQWNFKEYDGRVFGFEGGDRAETIRYEPGEGAFLPFNGYNVNKNSGYTKTDICTDWSLSCVWRVETNTPSRVDMLFSSFDDRYRAEFHSDGLVRLLHQRRDASAEDWEEWGRTDVGAFTPKAGRRIALVNVDYRAAVWVDGRCVLASTDEQYAGAGKPEVSPSERIYHKARDRATLLERLDDTNRLIQSAEAKLDQGVIPPAQRRTFKAALLREKANFTRLRRQQRWFVDPKIRITGQGGPFALWHVNLQRDVFYTQSRLNDPRFSRGNGHDPKSPTFDFFRHLCQLQEEGQNPKWFKFIEDRHGKSWGALGNPIFLKDFPGRSDRDEFFCLGDNSAQSHDGRSWNAAAPSLRLYDEDGKPSYQLGTVPRYNILGRAMLVYWPAGFPLPILDWPIVPNVGRIRLIR